MSKQELLESAERIIQSFMSGDINVKKFESDLSVTISSLLEGKKVDVAVVNQNRKEFFFGARIFPNFQRSNRLLSSMTDEKSTSFTEIYKIWRDIDFWQLELDAQVFDSKQALFTPKEVLAFILHEIGHTIVAGYKIEAIYNAYMDTKSQVNSNIKQAFPSFKILLIPAIVAACKYREWRLSKDDLAIELFADKTAVEYGYGEALVSAISKCIKEYGKPLQTTNAETEVDWAFKVTNALFDRQMRAMELIYIKGRKEANSNFLKDTFTGLLSKFGVAIKTRTTGAVAELYNNNEAAYESLFNDDFMQSHLLVLPLEKQIALETTLKAVNNSCEIAMESFGSKKKKEKDVDIEDLQYDIDKIYIDADKITSHYDRVYVLDLIYGAKEKLNAWEERLDTMPELKPRYGAKVQRMADQLIDIRKAVLNKKNFDKRYEVFVKYPEGYEG